MANTIKDDDDDDDDDALSVSASPGKNRPSKTKGLGAATGTVAALEVSRTGKEERNVLVVVQLSM